MFSLVRKIFHQPCQDGPARGKAGARAYAIGDIHGRLDLLHNTLAQIDRDVAAHEPRQTFVIFLGDFIDRGPESAGVLDRLRTYQPSFATPIFLAGNHEEVLLTILRGKTGILQSWLKFGGAECAASYGVDATALKKMDEKAAIRLLNERVPEAHQEFLGMLADTFTFGDYLFVHAGIRPGVSLEEQSMADLRWIREPFLSCDDDHGYVVVHGHTIVDMVEERSNRIGIDTGAYRSGKLTTLVVEDDQRRYIVADDATLA